MRQNRILNVTLLVGGRQKVVIPVSCVEQGRWARKLRHFAAAQSASGTKPLPEAFTCGRGIIFPTHQRYTEAWMRHITFAAVILVLLGGCAGVAGYSRSMSSQSYDSSLPYYDDRYWPPVVPGQPFPPQMMDGDGRD